MLISFCTTSSSNLRPIRRLTANSVLAGLVTAWRLADWPTSTSSSFVKATIEGVVRSPSLFSMTRGLPPSITATHELVVPRSMPITLLISWTPKNQNDVSQLSCGQSGSNSSASAALGRPGNDHPRRPEQPAVELVTGLQYLQDGSFRYLSRGLCQYRFMQRRIKAG